MPLYEPIIAYDQAQDAYWKQQTVIPGTSFQPLAPNLVQGSLMTCVFNRAVEVGFTEDVAVFGIHLAVEAGPGVPMSILNAADAAAVEAAFYTVWGNPLKPLVPPRWTFKEFQWRNYGADFPLDENGMSKPGPLWRVTPIAEPGTATGTALPDQIAASVTYKTASRAHWGRNYWVGPQTTWFSTELHGKLSNALVDNVAGAWHSFFASCDGLPRVVSPWVWSARYRGACSVVSLQMDDVPDVIRSRRAKEATYRKIYTS